jgi:deoxyribonuclease-2
LQNDEGYLLYNDQDPLTDTTSSTVGHSKGVVSFDTGGGYWLVHSVPRYPDRRDPTFPHHERIYGQTFLCISLSVEELEKVAGQLIINRAGVYDSKIPTSLRDMYPVMMRAKNKEFENTAKAVTVELTSKNGRKFHSIAKSPKWSLAQRGGFTGGDLYEGLVAPFVASDLYVETWMRPKHPSFCKKRTVPFSVVSVLLLKLDGVEFRTSQDHSKWAISKEDGDWICIGDINFMPSQMKRGGGTVCFENEAVSHAFRSLVIGADECRA